MFTGSVVWLFSCLLVNFFICKQTSNQVNKWTIRQVDEPRKNKYSKMLPQVALKKPVWGLTLGHSFLQWFFGWLLIICLLPLGSSLQLLLSQHAVTIPDSPAHGYVQSNSSIYIYNIYCIYIYIQNYPSKETLTKRGFGIQSGKSM